MNRITELGLFIVVFGIVIIYSFWFLWYNWKYDL